MLATCSVRGSNPQRSTRSDAEENHRRYRHLCPTYCFFLYVQTKPEACISQSSANLILLDTFWNYPNPNGYLHRMFEKSFRCFKNWFSKIFEKKKIPFSMHRLPCGTYFTYETIHISLGLKKNRMFFLALLHCIWCFIIIFLVSVTLNK